MAHFVTSAHRLRGFFFLLFFHLSTAPTFLFSFFRDDEERTLHRAHPFISLEIPPMHRGKRSVDLHSHGSTVGTLSFLCTVYLIDLVLSLCEYLVHAREGISILIIFGTNWSMKNLSWILKKSSLEKFFLVHLLHIFCPVHSNGLMEKYPGAKYSCVNVQVISTIMTPRLFL